MARLVCQRGDLEGQTFSIDKGVTLGRERHNTISLPKNRKWSRDHAKIWQVGVNRYAVADLGSTNGTLVNDERTVRADLEDGDSVQIGDVIFRFELDEEEKPKPKVRETASKSPDLADILRGDVERTDKPTAASLDGHAAIQIKERILQYKKKSEGSSQMGWDISQTAGLLRLGLIVLAVAVFVGVFYLAYSAMA